MITFLSLMWAWQTVPLSHTRSHPDPPFPMGTQIRPPQSLVISKSIFTPTFRSVYLPKAFMLFNYNYVPLISLFDFQNTFLCLIYFLLRQQIQEVSWIIALLHLFILQCTYWAPLCVKPWVGPIFGNRATATCTTSAVYQRLVFGK